MDYDTIPSNYSSSYGTPNKKENIARYNRYKCPFLNIFISQPMCCPSVANLITNDGKAIIVLARVDFMVVGQEQDFVNCRPEGCSKAGPDPYCKIVLEDLAACFAGKVRVLQ